MPISTKTRTSLLTPDFATEIAQNGKIDNEIQQSSADLNQGNSSPKTEAKEAAVTETRSKYNDVANLHFSRGKKAEFKAFFSAHEVTLVQGVENAVNYIMKEVKAGRLTVSRNGIEKTGE